MPEYTYVDTRILWLLMFLSTGFLQYVLLGAVRLVLEWTRKREAKPDKPAILSITDYRKEKTNGG